MSTTYRIVCTTCKESLWIGQSTHSNEAHWYFYTAEPATVKNFQSFMRKHQSNSMQEDDPYDILNIHNLRFIDDQQDVDDFADLKDDGTYRTWT